MIILNEKLLVDKNFIDVFVSTNSSKKSYEPTSRNHVYKYKFNLMDYLMSLECEESWRSVSIGYISVNIVTSLIRLNERGNAHKENTMLPHVQNTDDSI